jgi:hypothetical protein
VVGVLRYRLERRPGISLHISHRLARLLAAGVTAGALTATPALALARPIDDPRLPQYRDGGVTAAVTSEPAPADAPVVVRRIDEGFDWGSAAIGAGGAGALAVLASLGGFSYASRTRNQATQ